jgi:hypothetical protein
VVSILVGVISLKLDERRSLSASDLLRDRAIQPHVRASTLSSPCETLKKMGSGAEAEAPRGESALDGWLETEVDGPDDARYRHHVMLEVQPRDPGVADELRELIERAHADYKQHLARLAGDPAELMPEILESGEAFPDPTAGWPNELDPSVLMGYFGEILSGFVAERHAPHEIGGWRVAAYLFRNHDVAFEQLERTRQTGEDTTPIPGRTGDDCLAFVMEDGEITHALFCEAKCYQRHSSDAVEAAHEKISVANLIPVSLLALVEVLRDSTDPDAAEWVRALQLLRLRPRDDYERLDMVVYICGQRARSTHGYMPCDAPHPAYTGDRRLEAVDVHVPKIGDLVKSVYAK